MEPVSYWLDTTPPLATEPTIPRRAQVVVVGAGVFGASTALCLARAGADTLLLDQGSLASGATGRNAGIVTPGTTEGYLDTVARLGAQRARQVWQFTEDGAAGLRQVIAEEGIDAGYRAEGSLALALSAAEADAQQAAIERLAHDGFDLLWLDRDALQARTPLPLPPHVYGARYQPRGAVVHSGRLVRGLALAAQRYGTQIRQHVAVHAVEPSVVETDQGTIQADHVVLTVNALADGLVPRLKGILTPVRGQMRATVPLPLRVFPGAWSANGGGEYWQQTADGSWALGGMRRVAADMEIGLTTHALRPEVQAALDDFVRNLFPTLADTPVAYRWSGIMGFTPDSTPLIGALGPGVWIAAGCSGHGMPFAMEAGRQIAALVCRGAPDRDMAAFDPARFG